MVIANAEVTLEIDFDVATFRVHVPSINVITSSEVRVHGYGGPAGQGFLNGVFYLKAGLTADQFISKANGAELSVIGVDEEGQGAFKEATIVFFETTPTVIENPKLSTFLGKFVATHSDTPVGSFKGLTNWVEWEGTVHTQYAASYSPGEHEYLVKLQKGNTGGIVTPIPSATYTIEKDNSSHSIFIQSSERADGTPEPVDGPRKKIPSQDEAEVQGLIDELKAILGKIPGLDQMHLTSKDIYGTDMSVTFDSDKFKWSNVASGGWPNESEITPTEEDKKQFEYVAGIVKGIFDKWY
ncbi:hypothetical protein CONPUDRAFT_167745 [Coniophora puteana RWD-64-598 SS2]|uniref:Uncharacterized protein n=1 Tax=Coniophora puteana (strain RWD-64-598) TaxID=741705 RepID=A0A5M3MG82_CONPW|nr:uncharacterized protein CONPUDRAFT_167745 [Coniophora puteana RWD-64-598 SS2]EIW77625.1 hypothetical protein CONPUDRAFT_167745 [Coniophora puteana RWD-64-598 SS2]